ncbi:hypothetical protein AMJ80_09155 [bacterium SM23_31]|nr:MAG: hypothetical protein AMJ80_09155 [bacterium SM23_31]
MFPFTDFNPYNSIRTIIRKQYAKQLQKIYKFKRNVNILRIEKFEDLLNYVLTIIRALSAVTCRRFLSSLTTSIFLVPRI